jgi:hypothetical protein
LYERTEGQENRGREAAEEGNVQARHDLDTQKLNATGRACHEDAEGDGRTQKKESDYSGALGVVDEIARGCLRIYERRGYVSRAHGGGNHERSEKEQHVDGCDEHEGRASVTSGIRRTVAR